MEFISGVLPLTPVGRDTPNLQRYMRCFLINIRQPTKRTDYFGQSAPALRNQLERPPLRHFTDAVQPEIDLCPKRRLGLT